MLEPAHLTSKIFFRETFNKILVKLFLWNGGNFVNFKCILYNKWNQIYCYCVWFIVKIYVEPSYDFILLPCPLAGYICSCFRYF